MPERWQGGGLMRPAAVFPDRIARYVTRREIDRRHVRMERSEDQYRILRTFAGRLGTALIRFREHQGGRRTFGQLLMDQLQRRRRVFW